MCYIVFSDKINYKLEEIQKKVKKYIEKRKQDNEIILFRKKEDLIDMKYYGILVIVLIIICLCYLIFGDKKNYNRVPKKIWTYWDNPRKIPKSVKMCMEGWKKYNPNYKIILLTKENYKGYVTIPVELTSHPNFNDFPARFADLVRIWTLAEHGGVWIDSSMILKAPLDDWLFPRSAEFSGFYIDGFTSNKKYPVIENWFFACNKRSEFVRLWRDEFSEIGKFPNVEKYVESRRKFVDFQKIDNPIYLAMHVSAQKVLQVDKYPLELLILKKAEDGPFRYLVDTKWNSEKALDVACSDKRYQEPIMKIRGAERGILEKKINDDLSIEKCEWI
jgi:hypothetical protein